jgi:hypothetical protein
MTHERLAIDGGTDDQVLSMASLSNRVVHSAAQTLILEKMTTMSGSEKAIHDDSVFTGRRAIDQKVFGERNGRRVGRAIDCRLQ